MIQSFLPVFSLIAAIAMYFFYIGPGLETLSSLQNEEIEFDSAILQVRELENQLEELETQFLGITPDERERLEKLIPSATDDVRLILEVDNIAATHGMLIDSVRVDSVNVPTEEGADKPPYSARKLAFSVVASYERLLDFLHDIERSLHLMDVEEITFVGTEEDEPEEFNVELRVYALP